MEGKDFINVPVNGGVPHEVVLLCYGTDGNHRAVAFKDHEKVVGWIKDNAKDHKLIMVYTPLTGVNVNNIDEITDDFDPMKKYNEVVNSVRNPKKD